MAGSHPREASNTQPATISRLRELTPRNQYRTARTPRHRREGTPGHWTQPGPDAGRAIAPTSLAVSYLYQTQKTLGPDFIGAQRGSPIAEYIPIHPSREQGNETSNPADWDNH